jgi:hypothetical protein
VTRDAGAGSSSGSLAAKLIRAAARGSGAVSPEAEGDSALDEGTVVCADTAARADFCVGDETLADGVSFEGGDDTAAVDAGGFEVAVFDTAVFDSVLGSELGSGCELGSLGAASVGACAAL